MSETYSVPEQFPILSEQSTLAQMPDHHGTATRLPFRAGEPAFSAILRAKHEHNFAQLSKAAHEYRSNLHWTYFQPISTCCLPHLVHPQKNWLHPQKIATPACRGAVPVWYP
mmetsp:Transcript_6951/g.21148  ORF Transcript_6951/g.21148 Transcript_6951/m.21148 type:complete len:112 (-) Transcript_6951:61-396(-)